ncbi:glycoside-pentoside-hexuronide (GPH):cation symporter [Kordiimonas sp. SCSIO 12610]|uniref:glycoside-pentoside-hexuronide (GPH):cation symporter n=1 Tax=Kordiimonas sp. SCSIO 12610 TaxID=2829597 RepID=UPI00210DFE1F|nr:glycoside-pentoside-hexuronide (GPH):cation symporter [Kordiimonas sp. SCSIO 12610]UTW54692.1 glycoside-pentoside-hexuronide (GPH):cation symporter [Kordiimonas sp. SCSIO 12610]
MTIGQKLSKSEKIGFSLGDMAGNFVYQSVVLLLAFYYTDIYGLDAITVTSIFLFVRILDAVTDPLMGIVADRTQTRWGKYRPYLLILCIPYALVSILVFTVPDLDQDGKILYAYITYSLLMVFFTATNIPYTALGNVMTSDPSERTSLYSYRFAAATFGGLIVTVLLVPLADYLGGEDKAKGYQLAMAVLAFVSVILFFITVATTKERIVPVNNGKIGYWSDFLQVLKNDQWRIFALALFVMVASQTIKATVAIYYLTYYVEDAATMVSLFLGIWMVGGILGSALASRVVAMFGGKVAWVWLAIISGVLSAVTYFIAADYVIAIIAMQFFVGFFNQMMAPILASKAVEVIDYGELVNHRRLDALTGGLNLSALKIGLAIGGAMATAMLGWYGYVSGGVEQSSETTSGILIIFTLVPAVGFFLTAAILSRFSLTPEVIENNAEQLVQIRKQSNAAG